MTIIEMFSNLKINLAHMCEYVWVRPNTISNKMSQWYDITEEEMIKIMKRIDKKMEWLQNSRSNAKIKKVDEIVIKNSRANVKMKKIDKVLDHK